MPEVVVCSRFGDLDLRDPFFDSLKQDYLEFSAWFQKKKDAPCYIFKDNDRLKGFLFVKIEDEAIADVVPPLPAAKRLKIGTFKIDAHGTKLGQRFLRKAFDHALVENVSEIYVTVFPKHVALIALFHSYGFETVAKKTTHNGVENVMRKSMGVLRGDIRQDYPFVDARINNKYLLGIRPEWHTKLFPDSKLFGEDYTEVQDISHTNSIEKAYVCFMDLSALRIKDNLVIYRTTDNQGSAWYRSVATSICTVTEVLRREHFSDADSFAQSIEPISVFSADELKQWWRRSGNLYAIKMVYNAALRKRPNRKRLVEEVGLDPEARWGFLPITNDQFTSISTLGAVNDRLIFH
jgi:L-amino acid N-acyltransferase YncA